MNLHLPNLDNVPPGGWRYKVPETGQEFEQASLSGLIDDLTRHYQVNGYPLPNDLPQRIEEATCARIPDYCGGEPRQQDFPKPMGWVAGLAHSFHVVLQGTRTLANWWIVDGRKLVPPEQSDARAKVCVSCPMNQEPQGCTSCNMNSLHAAARLITGSRATKYDAQLKSCAVCFCDLRAKVKLPQDTIWRNMSEGQREKLPSFCWLITEQKPVPLRQAIPPPPSPPYKAKPKEKAKEKEKVISVPRHKPKEKAPTHDRHPPDRRRTRS